MRLKRFLWLWLLYIHHWITSIKRSHLVTALLWETQTREMYHMGKHARYSMVPNHCLMTAMEKTENTTRIKRYLKYSTRNFIKYPGCKTLNLPRASIKDLTHPVEEFKCSLNKYLQSVLVQSGCGECRSLQATALKSLADLRSNSVAWIWAELWWRQRPASRIYLGYTQDTVSLPYQLVIAFPTES